MVMRPDVVDRALARASPGAGTGGLPHPARPAARSGDGARLAARAVADAALRPVRGRGRAGAGGARRRGGEPRRFRALGRRAGGAGADRCGGAAAARRGGRGGDAGGREFRTGIAGVSPLHAARRMAGTQGAGGADLRSPREGQGLAAKPGGSGDEAAAAGSLGSAIAPRRTGAKKETSHDDHHRHHRQGADRQGRRQDSGVRARRHAARQRQGDRRHARARPGLRGRVHRAARMPA